jgi:3-dehydroquinate synthase
MTDRIQIRTSVGSYTVEFDNKTPIILESQQDRFFIVDQVFIDRLDLPNSQVFWISADEEHKSLQTIEQACLKLKSYGLSREGTICAIGGGVTQDIATLTAALYMRGVPYEYFPTTVLGMVDSCIGGKSSINVGTVKNLIGNIYPPTRIRIDSRFANSLSVTAISSGLAEALKIAFCSGRDSFIEMFDLISEFQLEDLEEVSWRSLRSKKWFIETDEFDQAERLQLNFGHTFGHAIETATRFAVPHGIAVAIGMMCAVRIAQHIGVYKMSEDALFNVSRSLISSSRHQTSLDQFDEKIFRSAFRSDKKHSPHEFCLVLPIDSEGVRLFKVPRSTENEQMIFEKVSEVIHEVCR